MSETPSRRLAVLLHTDVVGSTALVQLNETLAHQRIQDTFRRFSETIASRSEPVDLYQRTSAIGLRADHLISSVFLLWSTQADTVDTASILSSVNLPIINDWCPRLSAGFRRIT